MDNHHIVKSKLQLLMTGPNLLDELNKMIQEFKKTRRLPQEWLYRFFLNSLLLRIIMSNEKTVNN